jgi:hypothetical protein
MPVPHLSGCLPSWRRVMLRWHNANGAGELIDRGANRWRAGHCNDVLEVADTTVVAASDTSGVWLLGPGVGVPLSLDWSELTTMALAFGPLGRTHLIAGGAASDGSGWLRQTDASRADAMSRPWLPIRLPAGVGAIRRIVVDPVTEHVILATTQGLWHGPIPPAGASVDASLSLVGGTGSRVDWFDLVLTANRGCVAVTVDAATAGDPSHGFFVGNWDDSTSSLDLAQVDAGAGASQFQYTRLAVAPSDTSIVYAAGADNNLEPAGAPGTFRGLLRSTDAGQTWEQRNTTDAATGSMIVDHAQTYGYTGAIAVSPSDHDSVVLGYTHGYVSRDGGNEFAEFSDITHDDKHAFRFGASGRLWEASDGGIAYTDDMGARCYTHLNARLANLQFNGPSAGGFTTGSAASPGTSGLVGGGLQDNDNTYCRWLPDHSASPWFLLNNEGDGQAVRFLASGHVLWAYGSTYAAPLGGIDPLTSAPIPVRHANPAQLAAPTTLNGVFAAVPTPVSRHDRVVLAVLVSGADLYGLFDTDGLGWEFLGSLPLQAGEMVTAIASLTGSRILVGVNGTGAVYVVDPDHVSAASRSTVSIGSLAAIYSIVVLSDSPTIVALAAAYDPAPTWQLFSTADGMAWAPTGWPVDQRLVAIAAAAQSGSSLLFAASPSEVFVSDDNATSWHSESSGLPTKANCTDLACVANPDGVTRLYLATWGWSMWEADVAWATVAIRQTTDRAPCADVFPATDVIQHERATFEAVMRFHGDTGPVESYSWTTTGGGTLRADGSRATLDVGPTVGPFTIQVTVVMSDGRMLTAQRQLTVISQEEAEWLEISCRLRRYIERVQRIPPIIVLNRAGPDPVPFRKLEGELHAARVEFDHVVQAVERVNRGKKAAAQRITRPTTE